MRYFIDNYLAYFTVCLPKVKDFESAYEALYRKEFTALLHTRFTEEYGFEIPFISAGMAFVAMPPLVAAVSNSGGMGTLGAALVPPDGLRGLIEAIALMTSRPVTLPMVLQIRETMVLQRV